MKKSLSLFLALALIVSMLTVIPFGNVAAAEAETVIADFESGTDPYGDSFWSPHFDVSKTTATAKTGTGSLQAVWTTADAWNNPYFQNAAAVSIPVDGNTKLSLWVKGETTATDGSIGFRVRFKTADGQQWYNYNSSLAIADIKADWVKVELNLSDFLDSSP